MLDTNGREPISHRARFASVEDGFNIQRPALEPRAFDAERDRALDPSTPSGAILLDMRDTLMTPYAATTPLLLAKFLRIRAGEEIRVRLKASAEIYYVLQGRGSSEQTGGEMLGWDAGDIFCLAGGAETIHRADAGDTVLYSVTDEPLLAFSGVEPAPLSSAPIEAVHYSAGLIAHELDALFRRTLGPDTPGRALFLTSRKMEATRTCTPALTLTLNAVLPGERQPPHRHSAAAIVFVIKGGPVSSAIGDHRLPWDQASVLLTPPNAVHSHENTGQEAAVALIVQDGALHYHCRTMGFEFA
jgi:gentisate 1,2-dioxygenase